MTDTKAMAQLLFPDSALPPQEYETRYPPRELKEGAKVCRFAPSPTGHMHLGNLLSSFVSERAAHTSGGVFYVRIEDTDHKREVENGVGQILDDLSRFGLAPDEGVVAPLEEKGAYGPYQQSHRRDIYHTYVKSLVEQGLAYPCFCTAEELEEIRRKQEAQKLTPGYWGEWAVYRDITVDEAQRRIQAGQPYVVRLRSPGREDGKVVFDDLIKGKIEMPENTQDIVLLKADGIPTYHFAHVVDDHLMRTNLVVRGDEWIASAPIHLQLFRLLGFKPPRYAHIAPLMKEENGGKRKFSKRKDPEFAVAYFIHQGYPAESVKEYLLTLMNSNFEDWRRANPDARCEEFPFSLKKMSPSGALFDLVKFTDVSKNVISRMSAGRILELALAWAAEFSPELHKRLSARPEYAKAMLSIDRTGKKPRKDIAKWDELMEYFDYFYNADFPLILPEGRSKADAAEILAAYCGVYRHDDDRDAWFARVKDLCAPLGYSPDVKAYKAAPDQFKGHVGDVSAVIRAAITGRLNTPDLHSILQVLGEEEVVRRLHRALDWCNDQRQ